MKVSDAMSRDVRVCSPNQTLRDVARLMADIDAGSIPIAENDRLIGMITDRDIAVRAVAAGKGPDEPVRDVMTQDIKYAYDDEELDNVARNMADQRVRRLPVVNRDKRLVGILSVGDIAVRGEGSAAGQALSGVSRPGGPHSQEKGRT